MDKPKRYADITPEHIAEWKKSRAFVEEVTIPLDNNNPEGECARFVIAPITNAQQRVLNEIASDKKKGATKFLEGLHANAILGGDLQYLEDEYKDSSVMMALTDKIADLISEKKTITKRL